MRWKNFDGINPEAFEIIQMFEQCLVKSAENYTEEGQATYIVNNLVGIYPEVETVVVYELYDYDYTEKPKLDPNKENYFGLLTMAYRKKQVYYDLKDLRLNPLMDSVR